MPKAAVAVNVEQDHETADPGLMSPWQPRWRVDVGHGCEVGITIDDGCFVVLYQNESEQWRPGSHIPLAAARLIGTLDANA